MRAVVISEIDGAFKKLVWIEECRGGIYVGFYGKGSESHYSYHKDGTVHLKHSSSALHLYKTEAINDIKKFSSISAYGIPLEKGYEFITSDYTKSKDANTIIYINPGIIKRQKILNIHTYIVRKGAEKDCIYSLHKLYQAREDQGFEVLNANFFKLDKFRGFLVGIVFCGAR